MEKLEKSSLKIIEHSAKRRKVEKNGRKKGSVVEVAVSDFRWFCRGCGDDYRHRKDNDEPWLQCDCCRNFSTCSKKECCDVMEKHEEYSRLMAEGASVQREKDTAVVGKRAGKRSRRRTAK